MTYAILPSSIYKAGRVTLWVLAGLLALGVVAALWIGVRGALAYQHLNQVRAGAAAATASFMADPSNAIGTLEALSSDAAAARNLTSDPVWAFSSGAPWIGPQLKAFSTVAAASDELLTGSLLPFAKAAEGTSFDSVRPTAGRVDVGALSNLVSPAREAANHALAASRAVDDIDQTPLVGVVASAVARASDSFDEVSGALDTLSRTSQLLPNMLGQSGPRNYLLLVQNNSEWRSLGGITGTAILLHTDDGSLSLVDTRSATDIARDLPEPAVGLNSDLTAIYGTRPARYFHNVTQIPDFTVDGEIARRMYKQRTGVEVDGVLAVDPVVLSYLLKATGPVTLPTGDILTSDNAVSLLLNDVYLRYADPATQDAVFASAAGAVFQRLLDGHVAIPSLITALSRAGDERRLLLWNADEADQSVIEGTQIAGQLPASSSRTTIFGVFLNDATGSKMSYYVKPEVSVTWDSCRPERDTGERRLTVRLTLTSTAPPDAATLPEYITGGGAYGTRAGDAKVISNFFLPEGSQLLSASATDGGSFSTDPVWGRQVLSFETTLQPGTSQQIDITVGTMSTATHAQLIMTPTADSALAPVTLSDCTPDRAPSLG